MLGAEVIDFPMKTHCCGGHMTQIGPETAFELIRRLVSSADELKADLMATLCPMCQLNLDAYQAEANRYFGTDYQMPVIFFTQLMGLAFGMEPGELGFGLELVSAKKALEKIGADPPETPAAKPRPRRPEGLPMPAPLCFGGCRLTASYANFYITNAAVLVPTFNDPNDRVALGILGEAPKLDPKLLSRFPVGYRPGADLMSSYRGLVPKPPRPCPSCWGGSERIRPTPPWRHPVWQQLFKTKNLIRGTCAAVRRHGGAS